MERRTDHRPGKAESQPGGVKEGGRDCGRGIPERKVKTRGLNASGHKSWGGRVGGQTKREDIRPKKKSKGGKPYWGST